MAVFLILAASVIGFVSGVTGLVAFDVSLAGAIGLWLLPGPAMALMTLFLPGTTLRKAMRGSANAAPVGGAT